MGEPLPRLLLVKLTGSPRQTLAVLKDAVGVVAMVMYAVRTSVSAQLPCVAIRVTV